MRYRYGRRRRRYYGRRRPRSVFARRIGTRI